MTEPEDAPIVFNVVAPIGEANQIARQRGQAAAPATTVQPWKDEPHLRARRPLAGVKELKEKRTHHFAELAQTVGHEIQRLLRYSVLGHANDESKKAEEDVQSSLQDILSCLANYVDKAIISFETAHPSEPVDELLDKQLHAATQRLNVLNETLELKETDVKRLSTLLRRMRVQYYRDLDNMRERFQSLLVRHLPHMQVDQGILDSFSQVEFFNPSDYYDEDTSLAVDQKAKAMENQFSVEREAFIYQIRELTKSEVALKMKLKSRELEREESLSIAGQNSSTPASHSPPLVSSLKRSSVPKSVTLDPAVTYNDMTREAYQDALQQIEQSKRARKSMLTEVSGIQEITKQQQAWLEKIINTKETEMLRMTLKELAERTTAMTGIISVGPPCTDTMDQESFEESLREKQVELDRVKKKESEAEAEVRVLKGQLERKGQKLKELEVALIDREETALSQQVEQSSNKDTAKNLRHIEAAKTHALKNATSTLKVLKLMKHADDDGEDTPPESVDSSTTDSLREELARAKAEISCLGREIVELKDLAERSRRDEKSEEPLPGDAVRPIPIDAVRLSPSDAISEPTNTVPTPIVEQVGCGEAHPSPTDTSEETMFFKQVELLAPCHVVHLDDTGHAGDLQPGDAFSESTSGDSFEASSEPSTGKVSCESEAEDGSSVHDAVEPKEDHAEIFERVDRAAENATELRDQVKASKLSSPATVYEFRQKLIDAQAELARLQLGLTPSKKRHPNMSLAELKTAGRRASARVEAAMRIVAQAESHLREREPNSPLHFDMSDPQVDDPRTQSIDELRVRYAALLQTKLREAKSALYRAWPRTASSPSSPRKPHGTMKPLEVEVALIEGQVIDERNEALNSIDNARFLTYSRQAAFVGCGADPRVGCLREMLASKELFRHYECLGSMSRRLIACRSDFDHMRSRLFGALFESDRLRAELALLREKHSETSTDSMVLWQRQRSWLERCSRALQQTGTDLSVPEALLSKTRTADLVQRVLCDEAKARASEDGEFTFCVDQAREKARPAVLAEARAMMLESKRSAFTMAEALLSFHVLQEDARSSPLRDLEDMRMIVKQTAGEGPFSADHLGVKLRASTESLMDGVERSSVERDLCDRVQQRERSVLRRCQENFGDLAAGVRRSKRLVQNGHMAKAACDLFDQEEEVWSEPLLEVSGRASDGDPLEQNARNGIYDVRFGLQGTAEIDPAVAGNGDGAHRMDDGGMVSREVKEALDNSKLGVFLCRSSGSAPESATCEFHEVPGEHSRQGWPQVVVDVRRRGVLVSLSSTVPHGLRETGDPLNGGPRRVARELMQSAGPLPLVPDPTVPLFCHAPVSAMRRPPHVVTSGIVTEALGADLQQGIASPSDSLAATSQSLVAAVPTLTSSTRMQAPSLQDESSNSTSEHGAPTGSPTDTPSQSSSEATETPSVLLPLEDLSMQAPQSSVLHGSDSLKRWRELQTMLDPSRKSSQLCVQCRWARTRFMSTEWHDPRAGHDTWRDAKHRVPRIVGTSDRGDHRRGMESGAGAQFHPDANPEECGGDRENQKESTHRAPLSLNINVNNDALPNRQSHTVETPHLPHADIGTQPEQRADRDNVPAPVQERSPNGTAYSDPLWNGAGDRLVTPRGSLQRVRSPYSLSGSRLSTPRIGGRLCLERVRTVPLQDQEAQTEHGGPLAHERERASEGTQTAKVPAQMRLASTQTEVASVEREEHTRRWRVGDFVIKQVPPNPRWRSVPTIAATIPESPDASPVDRSRADSHSVASSIDASSAPNEFDHLQQPVEGGPCHPDETLDGTGHCGAIAEEISAQVSARMASKTDTASETPRKVDNSVQERGAKQQLTSELLGLSKKARSRVMRKRGARTALGLLRRLGTESEPGSGSQMEEGEAPSVSSEDDDADSGNHGSSPERTQDPSANMADVGVSPFASFARMGMNVGDLEKSAVETVNVAQQTDLLWESVPEQVLAWLKLNLMQREQSELYCTPWDISEMELFPGIRGTQRAHVIRDFEEFLDEVMRRLRPSKHEVRRGLRHRYRNAARTRWRSESPQALDVQQASRLSSPRSASPTRWQRAVRPCEYPLLVRRAIAGHEALRILAGHCGSEAVVHHDLRRILDTAVCRGRAECAPIHWCPSTKRRYLMEDDARLCISEPPAITVEGPRMKVNDVLGIALSSSVFSAATEQDPYCLAFAAKEGLELPEGATRSKSSTQMAQEAEDLWLPRKQSGGNRMFRVRQKRLHGLQSVLARVLKRHFDAFCAACEAHPCSTTPRRRGMARARRDEKPERAVESAQNYVGCVSWSYPKVERALVETALEPPVPPLKVPWTTRRAEGILRRGGLTADVGRSLPQNMCGAGPLKSEEVGLPKIDRLTDDDWDTGNLSRALVPCPTGWCPGKADVTLPHISSQPGSRHRNRA